VDDFAVMSETAIGQQLRARRESRAITLEQVAKSTHMRAHYLAALEAEDFAAIPSMAQARGFLRKYADFLELDSAPLLQALDGAAVPDAGMAALVPLPVERAVIQNPAPRMGATFSSLPAEPEASATIFDEVGRRLQQQRELLGLSLEDVIRHTHLRLHYLAALEAGKIQELPSPVQGRGMLKNYAAFLGLDPEPLLLRFAEGLQARREARQALVPPAPGATPPRPRRLPAPLRRALSNDLLVGGVLAVFLISFAVWGAIRIYSLRNQAATTPTAPSIAEILLAGGTPTPSPTAAPPTETPQVGAAAPLPVAGQPTAEGTLSVTLPAQGEAAVQVYVSVYQRAWLQVTVDGKVQFSGRVLPGNAYVYSAKDQVALLTGNGAAIQVFFNQQDQGFLGQFGQVVSRVYSREGVVTPTVTVTPTATATQRPSATPRPSATSRPASTAPPVLP
jgi:cytoskeletal protein RodZ